MSDGTDDRFVARWEVGDRTGAVVVVDVIRAFSTAAYAFGAGAAEIYLVDTVEEALTFKAAHRGVLAVGEDRGLRPDGFDLPNSPVMAAEADLDGRTLVQRTSAGTRGVVAARSATRLWCASLVCASATAASVRDSGLGLPAYVITGRFEDRPLRGEDDVLTAQLIERARVDQPIGAAETAAAVTASGEAQRTLLLGDSHVHPRDIELATQVDHFDFAMEVERRGPHLVLTARRP